MATRTVGFVNDTARAIQNFLATGDSWANYEEEYKVLTALGTLPTQEDVTEAFGFKRDGITPVLTLAQYNAALLQMQSLMDTMHTPTVANKLYLVKR